MRKMVHEILESKGYRVFDAENAQRALEVAQTHSQPIDLMITDIVMPGLNGRELAERLSRSNPKMKVLFMSGYTDDKAVRRGVVDANLAFIQKPFTPESLVRKIKTVLES